MMENTNLAAMGAIANHLPATWKWLPGFFFKVADRAWKYLFVLQTTFVRHLFLSRQPFY